MRLAGIPATRQQQPDRLLPIITVTVRGTTWGGDAQRCVHTHSTVDSLSGSSEFFKFFRRSGELGTNFLGKKFFVNWLKIFSVLAQIINNFECCANL